MTNAVGLTVRLVRSHKGLRQGTLAQMAGLSRTLLHELETGKTDWRLEQLQRVTAALDLTVEGLFNTAADISRALDRVSPPSPDRRPPSPRTLASLEPQVAAAIQAMTAQVEASP
jgi:DNA-binding XRE family transcriptional regulator